jgi:hypothetical protein
VKARYLAWAQRCCTRANCSAVPAVLVIGLVLVLLIAAHRTGLHEAAVTAAAGAGAVIVLLAAAAGLVSLAGRRRVPASVRARQPARTRPASGRAAAGLLGIPAPADRCACGDPAAAEIEGRPACSRCVADAIADGRLDDVVADFTAEADGQPAVELPPGYELLWPPVLPPGETAGEVDMDEFERRLQS